MYRRLCACGRDQVVGEVGHDFIDRCQLCLDELLVEQAEQRAPGSWSADTCLCGAPLERGQGLCAACEERADREARGVVVRPAPRRLRRWAPLASGRAA
jgi:hypothetical protein